MLPQPTHAPFTAIDPAHQGGCPTFTSEGQHHGITHADNCHYAHSATSLMESYPGTYEVGGACLCHNECGIDLPYRSLVICDMAWCCLDSKGLATIIGTTMSLPSVIGTIDCGDMPVVFPKRFVLTAPRISLIQSCSSSSLWGCMIGPMRTAATIKVPKPCVIQPLWEVAYIMWFGLWQLRYVWLRMERNLELTRLGSIIIL